MFFAFNITKSPTLMLGCSVAFGRNISSSIPVSSLEFVSLVDVCPASSVHTLSPRGYELPFLSSIPSLSESRSSRRRGSFCVRWLLSYFKRVQLTGIVGAPRSDHN